MSVSPSFLKNLSTAPGVYLMHNSKGQIIYVGKAKNLKRRVSSYFNRKTLDEKTQSLVQNIDRIEVIITPSEKEALLLEVNLIKEHRPKYNIILRDDKSYPYIFLSDHKFPRLDLHRGRKQLKGKYFGPYPSAGAVRQSMVLLQKLFKLRNCKDNFFSNRSRACLEYQIGRCKAPCVNYVDAQEYAEDVHNAELFLTGKSQEVIDLLAAKMNQASKELNYELAANFRDQISQLQSLQAEQLIYSDLPDADVIAIANRGGAFSVCMLMVRGGKILGTKYYTQDALGDFSAEDLLENFLAQLYLNNQFRFQFPKAIILNIKTTAFAALTQAINEVAGHKVSINSAPKRKAAELIKMAQINADNALNNHLSSQLSFQQRFAALAEAINLEQVKRIDCFDISHSHGEATIASRVVYEPNGPNKKLYRRFNIKDVKAGDDYAAMYQAVQRSYQKVVAEPEKLPDLVLIDGGKGQISQARKVFAELGLGSMLILGIAKGAGRKAGLETIYVAKDNSVLDIPEDQAMFHLLQQIRDEAHRFAITAHRNKRDQARVRSRLEGIPGVGPNRRQALLQRFGSVDAISAASVKEIAKTPGISLKLAELIFESLRT